MSQGPWNGFLKEKIHVDCEVNEPFNCFLHNWLFSISLNLWNPEFQVIFSFVLSMQVLLRLRWLVSCFFGLGAGLHTSGIPSWSPLWICLCERSFLFTSMAPSLVLSQKAYPTRGLLLLISFLLGSGFSCYRKIVRIKRAERFSAGWCHCPAPQLHPLVCFSLPHDALQLPHHENATMNTSKLSCMWRCHDCPTLSSAHTSPLMYIPLLYQPYLQIQSNTTR